MAVRSVYRGNLGATRTEQLHIACGCGTIVTAEVYRSVDASVHYELAARLRRVDAPTPFNKATCPHRAEPIPVSVSVIYHDPERELFVLVLPESQRYRSLSARIELLEELDSDPAPIPAYVLAFSVVFGARGLDDFLRQREEADIQRTRETERAQELERGFASLEGERAQLAAQLAEVELVRADFNHREQELARRGEELTRREAHAVRRVDELEQRSLELEQRSRELDQRSRELEQRAADLRAAQGAAQAARQSSRDVGRDTEPVYALSDAAQMMSGHGRSASAAPGRLRR